VKLDMEDGRMLDLPDELSDEFARQFKRLILTTEGRARDAEQRAADLQAEVAHLRAEVQALAARPMPEPISVDMSGVIDALQRIERGVRADRVIMADEFGEYTRSRIA
jgi:hypothetical protein